MKRLFKSAASLLIFSALCTSASSGTLIFDTPITIIEGYSVDFRVGTTKAEAVTLECFVIDNGLLEVKSFLGQVNYDGTWRSTGRIYVSAPDNDSCDYIFDNLIEDMSPQFRVCASNFAGDGEFVCLDAIINT